jgi:hypothetical protein
METDTKLFVSVSMTFQAVFSTLLTMGYCYLYLFPWLSKRCFLLFSQWSIVKTAWKVMETDTNNNTPLWEELKTLLGKSWKQIQITIPHCEKSWKHRLESHGNRYKSTLLTMEYCYLYLFPWLSKRCFQLFSQWSIVICICFHDFPSGVFNSSHNGVLLFVSDNTPLWEELKTPLGNS